MTPEEYSRFKTIWTAACNIFPNRTKPDDAALALSFGALSPLSLETVQKSLVSCLRTSKFMPTPAEIFEHATGGSADDRALIAWSWVADSLKRLRVSESVTCEDYLVLWAIKAMGGWTALYEMDREKAQRNFCEMYAAGIRQNIRPEEAPGHLAGRDEITGAIDWCTTWSQDMIKCIGTREPQNLLERELITNGQEDERP